MAMRRDPSVRLAIGAPARDSFDSTWQAAHFEGIERLLD